MNVNVEDKSTIAKICLGLVPGYFHNNETEDWYIIKCRIQDILKEAEFETGLFISFTVTPGDVLYKYEWGCKHGGERVALLEATRNPTFNPDEGAWKRAVQVVAKKLKDNFKQSTLTLTFQDATIVYLR